MNTDRYYTYIHTVGDNDIPVYVGKGSDNRYIDEKINARSKEWFAATENGYSSSIMAYGTKEEMLELEANIIKRLCGLGFNLVNKYHNPNYVNPLINTSRSEEHKKKMSDSSKDKPQSEAHTLTLMLSKITNGKSKGYSKYYNKYYARIKLDGKDTPLGAYDTPEEAHQVFLNANAKKIAELEARLAELQEKEAA